VQNERSVFTVPCCIFEFSMKKYAILLLSFCATVLRAQVPNPDLENWDDLSYNMPGGWFLYGKAKIATGYQSNRAIRIERDPLAPQTPGAILYGNAGANGIDGGIPLSSYPDSLVGYFKMGMEAGDTGFVLLILKKWGKTIGTTSMALIGNDSNTWARLGAPLYYTDTGNTDSVIVLVVGHNPAKNLMKSWVIVDSLHFSGGVAPEIPNGNFEQWNAFTRMDPKGWFSTNVQVPPGYPSPVSRSTDKVFGSYSARIQNVSLGAAGIYPGYILSGGQGPTGPTPGFPITERDTAFYINYKFFPQNTDTMGIGVLYYDSGVLVGAGFFVSAALQNTWKQVEIAIGYLPLYAGIPDSATVFCAPFQGGRNPTGESVLFVDGMKRNVPMNSIRKFVPEVSLLRLFPNPASNHLVVLYTAESKGLVQVDLYNSAGQKVKEIANMEVPAGKYSGNADISDLPNGIYFCELRSNGKRSTERVVISH
jgi:hypothetical protein